ncbi:PVC-type heme-binding CxxCH protein [Tautonia plasticadhaerens]|uniref:Cytochrome c n=1 Tax=Tautonia plasticadhaerens TaxID=2527974 RepID=A0A518GV47_9BACT|nr:PVC-type heme-binding CxxCH protein [Tautonia plasticadhaerens]QDV32458.1 Cytochrome c [Tautonia plasticadhaerens]
MTPSCPLLSWLAVLALGVIGGPSPAGQASREPTPEGLSPAEATAAIRVPPGFEVELVVGEPMVRDPVAFDWSADGRLWVVEMADYPLGVEGGGRVRVLEDTDGDGRYDASTVFLDGLSYPNGIMSWRDGVLISCAPDIRYAEDADGDGRCDREETLYTGFAEANPQHRLNGFALGFDGWVHAADADGGVVRSTRTGDRVTARGMDLLLRPDEGRIEPAGGRSQFGRQRNDWGDWFINNNSVWAWHVVLDDADLGRNPAFASSSTTQLLEPETALYPASRTLARFNDPGSANRATSACSPSPYRDDLLGPGFESSLFVCEPVHNLVHRMVLEPDGASYVGRRADGEQTSEFLASTEDWFRPVWARTGPDGALWIADMNRAVIEHPEWIPDDWEARIDLRAGEDRGRIYRVFPADRRPRGIARLDGLDGPYLVAAMDGPNGWRRDTCQRLLMHDPDPSAIGPLRSLATAAAHPEARVQALWTLACLGGLDHRTVERATADAHPEVRRAAILAGRSLLPGSEEVGETILTLVEDEEPRVRFAAALALGDWPDPKGGRALAGLALDSGGDHWFRSAVLSSARPHAKTMLGVLLERAGGGAALPEGLIAPLFASAASEAGPGGVAEIVRAVLGALDGAEEAGPATLAVLSDVLDEAARAGRPFARWAEPAAGLGREATALRPYFEAARAIAGDASAPEAARTSAVGLLARDPGAIDRDLNLLADLLRPQEAAPVQRAAIDAIARAGGDRVPGILLDGWRGHGPALRGEILETLLGRDAWRGALLDAIAEGRVPPSEVGPTHRERLLADQDAGIRDRTSALFGAVPGERGEVVGRMRSALALGGDPEAGRAVFLKSCAPCHRLEGDGFEVGPDLTALTDRSPEALLIAILDPNRAVEAKYASYTAATSDGRVVSGLIAEETSNAVALLRQGGERDVLPRSEIEEIAGSGKSLMPEGLEQDLDPRQLGHLIAFLRELGLRPKEVPGNHPTLVRPSEGGSVTLSAETAEIYGNRLTYEPTLGNLGWWIGDDDRAAWTFEVDRPGRYEVRLDWACDDGEGGGSYAIEVGADRIAGVVPGTGSWEDYRRATVGTVSLGDGRHRLEIRPEGRPKGALMDLRSVELRPEGPVGETP